MPIDLAEVTERSRVRWIHQVRLLVKLFRGEVTSVHLSHQTATHRSFDERALAGLEHRSREYSRNVASAEFLQLLRGLLRLLREHAFLIDYRAINLDRGILVAGFQFF